MKTKTKLTVVALLLVLGVFTSPNVNAEDNFNFSIHNDKTYFLEDRFVFEGEVDCPEVDCVLEFTTGGTPDSFNSYTYELKNESPVKNYYFYVRFAYNTQPQYIKVQNSEGRTLFYLDLTKTFDRLKYLSEEIEKLEGKLILCDQILSTQKYKKYFSAVEEFKADIQKQLYDLYQEVYFYHD